MARLDTDRQEELEPQRMRYAKEQIEKAGYKIQSESKDQITFNFLNEKVIFYPYSGWSTGKSIKDGRGLQNLLKQITPK